MFALSITDRAYSSICTLLFPNIIKFNCNYYMKVKAMDPVKRAGGEKVLGEHMTDKISTMYLHTYEQRDDAVQLLLLVQSA